MNLLSTLETVEWGQKHFGSVTTGGPLKRRDIQKAIAKGFVKSAGMVHVCDEDGSHVDPERFREGFILTEKGRSILAETKGADRE